MTRHILHLTPYYAPAYAFGGVVRAVEGLTRALVRAGHQVTVLTTDLGCPDDTPRDEQRDGVRVVRVRNLLPGLRSRANLSTPERMRQRALELLPDVDLVHVHEFRTVENLLVTPAAVAQGRPIVLSPHGTIDQSTGRGAMKKLWDRLLSPAVAQRIDRVVALTEQERADVAGLWPQFGCRQVPTAFDVVPNGIDPADFAHLPDAHDFRERYGLGAGPVVLFLGRLHPRKGLRVLAEAFQQIDQPDARLVIAGPDEGALAMTRPLLDERAVVTGYLDSQERLAALSAADVFALPAVGEGLSMAALEAMACELPVVLSPGCNLPEAAEAGAGLIVEPQSAPLAAALRDLINDPAQRARMGAAGAGLVRERFTWDAVAGQMLAVYDAALSGDRNNSDACVT